MDNFVHSNLGLVHLLVAFLATITGTAVLWMRKGTRAHKRVGYLYALSMMVLNGTALMIYSLFGYFGIFHYGAVLSALTVLGGMIPAIRRKNKNWIYRHLAFMYWSVIGLYAAFASETFTRVPEFPFFGMVGLATALVMIIGAVFYARLRKKWAKQFGPKKR